MNAQCVTGKLADLVIRAVIGLTAIAGCHGTRHICLRKAALFHDIVQCLADSVCSDSGNHNGSCYNLGSILQNDCLGCGGSDINSQCIHN